MTTWPDKLKERAEELIRVAAETGAATARFALEYNGARVDVDVTYHQTAATPASNGPGSTDGRLADEDVTKLADLAYAVTALDRALAAGFAPVGDGLHRLLASHLTGSLAVLAAGIVEALQAVPVDVLTGPALSTGPHRSA